MRNSFLQVFFPIILLQGYSLGYSSTNEGLNVGENSGTKDAAILKALKLQISENYGAAEVRLSGPIEWRKENSGLTGGAVQILSDTGRGGVNFSVSGKKGQYAEGSLPYSAWMPAQIAVRRIRPGELLRNEWFTTQKINVSTGPAREYRGVLLSPTNEASKFESVQTIMEGQFLTSSAIRAIPDIRRGDSVRIFLVNETLTLRTAGVAQEAGYVNRQIRVLTSKTKRELLGQLQADGIVEVKL